MLLDKVRGSMGRAGATILGLFLSIGGGQLAAQQVSPAGSVGEYVGVWVAVAAALGGVITAFVNAYFTHRNKRAEAEDKLVMKDHDYITKRLNDLETRIEEYRTREVEWSAERATLNSKLEQQEREIEDLREEIKKLKDATQGGGLVIR